MSHEIATSESGEQFVAMRPESANLCVGCPMDLDKDVEGVDVLVNTALRHVESERATKHVALKILRIQQQVCKQFEYLRKYGRFGFSLLCGMCSISAKKQFGRV